MYLFLILGIFFKISGTCQELSLSSNIYTFQDCIPFLKLPIKNIVECAEWTISLCPKTPSYFPVAIRTSNSKKILKISESNPQGICPLEKIWVLGTDHAVKIVMETTIYRPLAETMKRILFLENKLGARILKGHLCFVSEIIALDPKTAKDNNFLPHCFSNGFLPYSVIQAVNQHFSPYPLDFLKDENFLHQWLVKSL